MIDLGRSRAAGLSKGLIFREVLLPGVGLCPTTPQVTSLLQTPKAESLVLMLCPLPHLNRTGQDLRIIPFEQEESKNFPGSHPLVAELNPFVRST